MMLFSDNSNHSFSFIRIIKSGVWTSVWGVKLSNYLYTFNLKMYVHFGFSSEAIY